MPDLSLILQYFSPELILAVGALAILGYDLVVRGEDRGQAWVTSAILLAAVVATLWVYTLPPPHAEPVALTTYGGVEVACGQYGLFEARAPAPPGTTGPLVRCGAVVSDSFTQFFRLFGQITVLLVVLSAVRFMRGRTPFRGEFYAFLLCTALAIGIIAAANDLLLIALAIEFLSITSYVLTAYLRGDPLSSEGGLKYFIYGAATSAVMLLGLSLLFGTSGTTSLPQVAAVLASPDSVLVENVGLVAIPALVLIMVGVAFKIALVPFHQWSPDAYEGAPTPVTSFLSVGPKLAGFAVLIRLLMTVYPMPFYASQWLPMLALLAILTMVAGNLLALTQNNMKRMMAYSSIAQAGYMLVGVAAWSTASASGVGALASVLVYLLAYAFTNLGAFAVIIAVEDDTGSSDISAYRGLMRRAPFLAVAMAVFFLGLVGIPPLAGFIGKFAVFSAAIGAGQAGLALVGVVMGVVSVGYYFRVFRAMFFDQPSEGETTTSVAPAVRGVIVAALVMTLLIGLYSGPFIDFAARAAAAVEPYAAVLTAAQ